MPDETAAPSIWVRLVADERFRAAVIEDPLRALASAGDVSVSPDQVRQLEGMGRDARREAIVALVREAHWRGGQARFGAVGADGRIGGPDNPTMAT